MSEDRVKGFFAYPSRADIAETIRNGITRISGTGLVALKGWEQCKIGGKVVIQEICKEIVEAQFFCADLTLLNHNVMFELGFAIAKNKRVWLALDPTMVESKSDFEKFRILTTVGWRPYQNSYDIESKFLGDLIWTDLDDTIFNHSIRPHLPTDSRETLFYLKSRHTTEASSFISKEIERAASAMSLPLIVDDPRETAVQPLAWYAEQAFCARCVVAHLINPSREGAHLHNAKYAFVCGLAYGLEKPLLMLAQGDSLAPLDYRDILKQYQTGSEAEKHLHAWLVPLIERAKSQTGSQQQKYLASLKLAQQLGSLDVGEPIAENEAERLVAEYFIETSAYRDAFAGRLAIFVGRKGAGKSANFLKLEDALKSDKRNIVCVIKPMAYEMQGIIELMARYKSLNLRSYTIESIWKFLIYSEIAITAENAILQRPSGQIHSSEKDLIALLDKHSEMFRQDFSIRLERCIQALMASVPSNENEIEKSRGTVSETLHSGILKQLRETLVVALEEKQRIAVLVDNIDKAWDKQSDIDQLTEFLLGLLSAAHRLTQDFRSVGPNLRSLNMSLALFVRADIFARVMAIAREPDKIVHTKLSWNDPELLIRVIDERFSSVMGMAAGDVWSKFFVPTVENRPTKAFILERIFKRPRDLLYFIKAAITTAVNRRHAIVEERDILDAERQYSQFAVDSILVENGLTIKQLENVLYEFLGSSAVLKLPEVEAALQRAGVAPENQAHVIDHLCDLTFLGVEVKQDEFRFADDQAEFRKNAVLAQQLSRARGQHFRYKIFPAFWTFLEVQKNGACEQSAT